MPLDVHWTAYPAAFGGFVAAAVAAWIALRTTWRDRRARPKLRLIYDAAGEDFAAGAMNGRQHWVRLRVENEKAGRAGRRSADDVEVLVVRASDDSGAPLAQLEGCAFKWSNAHGQEGRPLTRLTIPPGVGRRFDLVAVGRPQVSDGGGGYRDADDVDGIEGARAELQVQPTPGDGSAWLTPGCLAIVLALTARDTDASYYEVDLEYDGKWWTAATVRQHLVVSVSPLGSKGP